MASIFTRIIQGEIPCHKIAEDDRFIAFLDINPVQKGHTLIVPKTEIDDIFDLPDDTLAAMLPFARRVATAIRTHVPCKKVAIAVIGLEVPHAHLHLVPITSEGDMDFRSPRYQYQEGECELLCEQLAGSLQ